MLRKRRTVAAVVVIAACGGAAFAFEPGFVGTWAANKAACSISQSAETAPTILTARGLDQHEGHCTFTSVRKTGAAWRAKAKCSVEGDAQFHTFVFSVSGDRLTISEAGVASKSLVRCGS